MAVFKTNLTITSTTTMKPSLWKFSTAFRSSLSSLSLDISSPIYWADRMTDECLNVLEWQNIFTFITPSQTTRTSRTIVSQRLNDKCKEWDLSWVYVSPVGGDDGGGGDGGGGGGGGGVR